MIGTNVLPALLVFVAIIALYATVFAIAFNRYK